jgi:hypothetical protein
VTLGYVALGEDDVIPLDTPNRYLVVVELQTPLLSTFFGDDDTKHSASGNVSWFEYGIAGVA